MDFTIESYTKLLQALISEGYAFQTFGEYLKEPSKKVVILRHDVDLLPKHSKRFAILQALKGIKGSYYFRAVPESWNENIIREIAEMGHEVGYHYETMDTTDGDIDLAWDEFRYHLDALRKLVDVNTICMHGSPRSKFDNKEIWKKYDYRSLGIIGEPYYDVNFDDVFYLTDTGRRWDGWRTSVRDKVPQQEEWIKQGLSFHSTNDIIKALSNSRVIGSKAAEVTRSLPNKIMFTMHPQRWHNSAFPWVKELILQNVKNVVKSVLYVKK